MFTAAVLSNGGSMRVHLSWYNFGERGVLCGISNIRHVRHTRGLHIHTSVTYTHSTLLVSLVSVVCTRSVCTGVGRVESQALSKSRSGLGFSRALRTEHARCYDTVSAFTELSAELVAAGMRRITCRRSFVFEAPAGVVVVVSELS